MWLALDTATDRASVALSGARLERSVVGARRHAAALPRLIAELLSEAGASADRLTGVVLADGPGSFTGLRVGASVAKGLVLAGQLPLRTMPSLLGRAAAAAVEPGHRIVVVSNALRGEVYAACYRFPVGQVDVIMPPTVTTIERLTSLEPPAAIVGDAPPEALERLAAWAGAPVITGEAGAARAGRLLELFDMPGAATAIADVATWEPTYGRPAEAQARWELSHGRPLPDSVGTAR
ncbi:MAG TPA: tRNA (adenosine(37)-N6)-threonylcarbamoyltransferase complex dimerization subunit type 1 TsaB [Gemmatimonadales bacterium]|nr:tRNA (adenosine(37)-N6)-threonylcarbamoyltransferase complex dimerization subunit type 1 TsaB [Gemmatimonadales bacterium]